jgi:hypothetical protein
VKLANSLLQALILHQQASNKQFNPCSSETPKP